MSRADEQLAVLTLRVTDELDIATTPTLRARVTEALAGRPQTLIVDLSACPFAGVDALHALAELTRGARRQGTTLLLISLRPIVRRTIAVLGLEGALLFAPPARQLRPGTRSPDEGGQAPEAHGHRQRQRRAGPSPTR